MGIKQFLSTEGWTLKTGYLPGEFPDYKPCFFFVGLKPFRPISAIAGPWNVGQGVTGVLGEMDVARVNPYPFGGQPPVLSTWFQPRRPMAVTQCRGTTQSLPLTQWATFTKPGLHRALGDGV